MAKRFAAKFPIQVVSSSENVNRRLKIAKAMRVRRIALGAVASGAAVLLGHKTGEGTECIPRIIPKPGAHFPS
jgi:hypothetical protein